jgi:hypothetical protein
MKESSIDPFPGHRPKIMIKKTIVFGLAKNYKFIGM